MPFASTSVGPSVVVLTVTPATICFGEPCADATVTGNNAATAATTMSAFKRLFMSNSSNGVGALGSTIEVDVVARRNQTRSETRVGQPRNCSTLSAAARTQSI